jgi:tetratricopeptide (TPR) repeat protein
MIDHVLKGLHEYIIKTIKMINEEIELRTGESIEKKQYNKLFNTREVKTDLIRIGQLFREDKKTVDEIIQLIITQDSNKPVYDTAQVNINNMGYSLMQVGRIKDALKIFELNIELHPDSYRTYDSYGECLLKLGDTTKAIKAYEKSVELNPNNQNGMEMLSKLKQQAKK